MKKYCNSIYGCISTCLPAQYPSHKKRRTIWYKTLNKSEIIKAINIDQLFKCIVLKKGKDFYEYKNAILFNPAAVNAEAYKLPVSEYSADMTSYIVEGEALNACEDVISKPISKAVYLPTQYPVDTAIGPINSADAIANHLIGAVKESIKQYNSNEKVIISRTVDNKIKELGENLNEAFNSPKVQQFLR
ncbi:hypothetical protein [Clostridium weizhouense]|uniref:Uncharacterized protein n=1 Tax=Clostridium weizhouense TaxID=2859781 RepID=A0ABS7AQM2_9CLOT|nr:hypothetical protein [Clostridium weizhouense]MBW6410696.1 hypothetical protein [Clostridium weizhouense]